MGKFAEEIRIIDPKFLTPMQIGSRLAMVAEEFAIAVVSRVPKRSARRLAPDLEHRLLVGDNSLLHAGQVVGRQAIPLTLVVVGPAFAKFLAYLAINRFSQLGKFDFS